jgi:tetratricopeptide (TPR) repeat protein
VERRNQTLVGIRFLLVCIPLWVALEGNLRMLDSAVPNERSEQLKILEEGKRDIAQKHFPEAIAAFGRLRQIAPQDPQAYFFSGIAFAESGHLNAGAAELTEAVRLGPDQPEHILALGNVLARLGQKREAMSTLAALDQGIALKRLSLANLSELMKVYFSLERTSEALRLADELESRQPNYPRIDFYRAKIYKLAGNLDLAQQAIQQSLKRTPDNPADLFELGKIYEQRGQMAAAKSAFLEVLKHWPNEPETLYALSSVCMSLDETDAAIEYLRRAEPAVGSLPKIYYALGQAFQKKGDSVKAAQYFGLQKAEEESLAQRQTEVREHEELLLISLARERQKLGNKPAARAFWRQLLELNSNSWEAHQSLGEIYLSSGDWQQARAHLDKLQEINPSGFQGNRLMAEYWYRSEDYAQALDFAERGRSVEPINADLRNLLGNIYLKLGQMARACEEYALAVKYAPTNTEFRKNLELALNLMRKEGGPSR